MGSSQMAYSLRNILQRCQGPLKQSQHMKGTHVSLTSVMLSHGGSSPREAWPCANAAVDFRMQLGPGSINTTSCNRRSGWCILMTTMVQ
jgi:hypothetical protein